MAPDTPPDDTPPDDTLASRRVAYTGEQIRRARQLARISQTELGHRVGVNARRVRTWEANGITQGAHTLAAVEQVLKLGEGPPNPFDVTQRPTLELITLLHAVAAELTARHLRGTNRQDTPPAVKWPDRPHRVPRVVDLPRAEDDPARGNSRGD